MPNYKVITSASEPLLVLNNQPYTDAELFSQPAGHYFPLMEEL